MQPKKTPKADLNRNSFLHFVIGLTLVLFFSWRLIEWKNYEKSSFAYETFHINPIEEEDIPIIKEIKMPPPPPKVIPEIFIVEDQVDVIETITEPDEYSPDKIIETVNIIETPSVEDIPFIVVEEAPTFPGCEKLAENERRKCFQERMNRHVRRTFRYPEIAQEMGIQGRVYVQFIIDEKGNITNIQLRGPDKNLEKEARRIIEKLPKMLPGKQRGRPVRVPFSYPITFRLQ